jgi:hypothetical protein
MAGAVWKATFCRVAPFLFSQSPMGLHQSGRCPVRLVKGAAAMVCGSPVTDFWAGG